MWEEMLAKIAFQRMIFPAWEMLENFQLLIISATLSVKKLNFVEDFPLTSIGSPDKFPIPLYHEFPYFL